MITPELINKIQTKTITATETEELLSWLKQQPDVYGTAHAGYLVRRDFGTIGVGTYTTHSKEFSAFYLPPTVQVVTRPVSERWSQVDNYEGTAVSEYGLVGTR